MVQCIVQWCAAYHSQIDWLQPLHKCIVQGFNILNTVLASSQWIGPDQWQQLEATMAR